MQPIRDALSRNRPAQSILVGERPYKFNIIPDSFTVRADTFNELIDLRRGFEEIGFRVTELDNEPVSVLRPRTDVDAVLDAIAERNVTLGNVKSKLRQALRDGGPLKKGRRIYDVLQNIDELVRVDINRSMQTYGPESFGLVNKFQDNVILDNTGRLMDLAPLDADDDEKSSPEDMHEAVGTKEAWEEGGRGEGVVYVPFDTSFCRDGVDRIINSWHGEDADSAFSDPGEGHGTMVMMTAVGNKDENGVMNGFAPDADVIPVRITDSEHSIRSDYITEALDWIVSKAKGDPETNYVLNHSYGMPVGKSYLMRGMCRSNNAFLVKSSAHLENLHHFYAGGNEATQYGHRLSGLTNAISAENSLADVVTVGALRADGRGARSYSSHGLGQCSPLGSPKPDFSLRIPRLTPYGRESEEGEGCWHMMDMAVNDIPTSSGGGTSNATPSLAGVACLTLSHKPDLNTAELKQIMKRASTTPRRTHINFLSSLAGGGGHDARFGYGEPHPIDIINEVNNYA